MDNRIGPSSARPPLHHHAFDEAFFVLEGELTFQLGSERHVIWAINDAQFWAFGYTSTATLASWSSPDGVTWTAGATHALSNAHGGDGRVARLI